MIISQSLKDHPKTSAANHLPHRLTATKIPPQSPRNNSISHLIIPLTSLIHDRNKNANIQSLESGGCAKIAGPAPSKRGYSISAALRPDYARASSRGVKWHRGLNKTERTRAYKGARKGGAFGKYCYWPWAAAAAGQFWSPYVEARAGLFRPVRTVYIRDSYRSTVQAMGCAALDARCRGKVDYCEVAQLFSGAGGI